MVIAFAKMNGNGNDFIVIDNRGRNLTESRLRDLARSACRRRSSLGADGLLVVEDPQASSGPAAEVPAGPQFRMRLFNRDGSEGEMCGNGARCVARYALEKQIAPSRMIFETLAGNIEAEVDPPRATISMGNIDLSTLRRDIEIKYDAKALKVTSLEVGVPHCVFFLDQLGRKDMKDRKELFQLGRHIRYNSELFPEGTNVNFVELKGKELVVVSYERGVEDFTESCGTGSTASAIVAHLGGLVGREVEVHNPGGLNRVSLHFPEKTVVKAYLSGTTNLVAWGELTAEALEVRENTGSPVL